MKSFILSLAALLAALTVSGQELIIINGQEIAFERMKDYTPSDDDRFKIIRDAEEAVAQFGEKGRHGVYIYTLPYDTPAVFTASEKPYVSYLYNAIDGWDEQFANASIRLRCKISNQGKLSISEVVVSDNEQLLKEVTAFIDATPAWAPAMKDGKAVESNYNIEILANQ